MEVVAAPRRRTPSAPAAGFRRTMHVAVGPDGPYQPGRAAHRHLHAAMRDLRDGAVAGSGHLTAEVTEDDVVAALVVDGRSVPGLLGIPATHGFRRQVVEAGLTGDAVVGALLLDLPVGVALSGYARMQSGRLAGRSTAEVIDPKALPRLADSCAGWASDGEAMTRVSHGTYRPPRLPPTVTDPDTAAWHDLGTLRPWWVRRRRVIDVVADDHGDLRVSAAFRDSWMDADEVERALHEWEVDLDVRQGTVAQISATPRSLPFAACPHVTARLTDLEGSPAEDLRRTTRERLGGVAGCTHLNDLLGAIPGAIAEAGAGGVYRG